MKLQDLLKETKSCAGKLPGESNAQWRARCGPRPLGAISRGGVSEGSLRRFKVYVSGEKEPLILLGKNEKEVEQTAYAMIRNSSVKVRKVVKEGKLTEKKQLYVVASTSGHLYTGDKGVTEKQALKIMDRFEKVGMNLFMLGVQYWNKPHKYNKKKIMVKEDFGMSAKQLPSFSSKEAKKIIDDSVRQYATLLRKAEAKIIKDWMTKAKSGVLDYFDIVRGLETGDASRAYPFELRFLKGILDRDKIMNRFRSYFKGKKGKKR